tara:strand:+ start:270 stop:512 length:243 start_codon:yes stop_codon:yes gene_type:complete
MASAIDAARSVGTGRIFLGTGLGVSHHTDVLCLACSIDAYEVYSLARDLVGTGHVDGLQTALRRGTRSFAGLVIVHDFGL